MHHQKSFEILFMFYDAGETIALKRVLEEFDTKFPLIKYSVLAMQTAARTLKGSKFNVTTLDSLGIHLSDNITRSFTITQEQLQTIMNRFQTPSILVTSMVSAILKQIALEFRLLGSKIVGYDDSFQLWISGHIRSTFIPVVDFIFVTANMIAQSALSLAPGKAVKIVGNPSTVDWIEEPHQINCSYLRQLLDISDNKPIMLYIGGYGKKFIRAFKMFLEAAKTLQETYHILYSSHPKVRAIGDNVEGLVPAGINIQTLPPELTTIRVSTICSVIVTRVSTVAMKCLFMGKPAVYFDVPDSLFIDLGIQEKLIPQARTASQFQTCLEKIKENRFIFDPKNLEHVGIPLTSTQTFIDELLQILIESNTKFDKWWPTQKSHIIALFISHFDSYSISSHPKDYDPEIFRPIIKEYPYLIFVAQGFRSQSKRTSSWQEAAQISNDACQLANKVLKDDVLFVRPFLRSQYASSIKTKSLEEAIDVLEEVDSCRIPFLSLYCQLFLSDCRFKKGEYSKAAAHARDLINLSTGLNLRKYECIGYGLLGRALVQLGVYEEALHVLNKRVEIADKSDRRGIGLTQKDIGALYRQLGNPLAALYYHNEWLKIFNIDSTDTGGKAEAFAEIGWDLEAKNLDDQARDCFLTHRTLSQGFSDQNLFVHSMFNIQFLNLKTALTNKSSLDLVEFSPVIDLAKKHKILALHARSCQMDGRTSRAKGNKEDAICKLEQAYKIALEIELKDLQAQSQATQLQSRILLDLASVLLESQRFSETIERCTRVDSFLEGQRSQMNRHDLKIFFSDSLAESRTLKERALVAQGKQDEALLNIERNRGATLCEIMENRFFCSSKPPNAQLGSIQDLQEMVDQLEMTFVVFKLFTDFNDKTVLWSWVIEPSKPVQFREHGIWSNSKSIEQLTCTLKNRNSLGRDGIQQDHVLNENKLIRQIQKILKKEQQSSQDGPKKRIISSSRDHQRSGVYREELYFDSDSDGHSSQDEEQDSDSLVLPQETPTQSDDTNSILAILYDFFFKALGFSPS